MPRRAPIDSDQRPQWSGQVGFVLSAIGSAVGLGNIWRFPRVAYENGGGAFLIPYLVAFFTAGIPILFLDYAIGHRFRGSPPLALRRIARRLEALGWFQVMINVFIALYYTVILAWAASFFVFSFTQRWGDDTEAFFYDTFLQRAADVGHSFEFVAPVVIPLAVVWLGVIAIIGLGVKKGVERLNFVAIPLLVVAFVALVGRAMYLPGAEDGLNEFFTPEFDQLLNAGVWVAAYGQIFFTLSISYGIMVTYSSYRRRKSNQTTSGLVVAFANSSFEILAGIGVFCILGYMALESSEPIDHLVGDSGVGLTFITFPRVVAVMPHSALVGALFFGSLLLAGFTSLISNVQVIVASVADKFGLKERRAALAVCVPLALVSISLFGTTTGFYTLDVMDHWTNELGVVVSAIVLTTAVFWGAKKGRELAFHLTVLSTFPVGRTWRFLAGVFTPVLLVVWLVQWLVKTLSAGFHGYAGWFLGAAGWGIIGLAVVIAFVATAIPWRRNPDLFTPWPVFTGRDAKPLAWTGLLAEEEKL
jgi:NSS family neurotransmitter:Na+ symporter